MYQPFKVIIANSIAESSVARPLIEYADRGLQYGDGCFTTMYCEGNRISLFEQHIKRLIDDAVRLKIFLDPLTLHCEVVAVLVKALIGNQQSLAIKLLLTRGVGGRGYEIPEEPLHHLYVSFHPCASNVCAKTNDYRIKPCTFSLSAQPLLAGIKHLNRIEQVLAKHELQTLTPSQDSIHDLIMLDQQDIIVECTAGNIFFFAKHSWHTPSLLNAGVKGVMRGAIINYMQNNNIPLNIGQYQLEELLNAESVFVCNAIKHLVPVTEIKYVGDTGIELRAFRNTEIRHLLEGFNMDLARRYTVFNRPSTV